MKRDIERYTFAADLSIDQVADFLLIAVYTAEAIHDRDVVEREASFSIDEKDRVCVIDATNPAGRTIAEAFADSLTREFGKDSFSLERTFAGVPAAVAAEVRP